METAELAIGCEPTTMSGNHAGSTSLLGMPVRAAVRGRVVPLLEAAGTADTGRKQAAAPASQACSPADSIPTKMSLEIRPRIQARPRNAGNLNSTDRNRRHQGGGVEPCCWPLS